MSSSRGVPVMAHSPKYYAQQQRQLEATQDPFNTNLPARPLPIANIIVASPRSSIAPHRTDKQPSSSSRVPDSRATHSPTGSSTFSNSQPASLASEGSRHASATCSAGPGNLKGHQEHRQSKEAGYAVQTIRSYDQVPGYQTSHSRPTGYTTYTYTRGEALNEGIGSGDHALWILTWLSFLCPLFSLTICLYTTGALVVMAVLTPLRLCTNGQSSGQQLIRLLSPSLVAQFSMIRATEGFAEYTASMLVLVHLLSPIISSGVAVSAWVAAFFWFYAAILGDPDGTNGKDDGRAAVMGVRAWWERWLIRALG